MKWKKDEIELLKSFNDKTIHKKDLENIFENRTFLSIKKKAKKLNLKISIYKNKQWSSNEIEILKRTKNKNKLLKLLPNRNWSSILRKAKKLNIKIHNNFWSEYEINFLTNNYCNSSKEFLLKNIDRSWDAIKLKAKNLKIKRNKNFFRKANMEKLLNDDYESFYWVGFLLADGHFNFKDKRILITLSNKDRNHLKIFEKYLQSKIYDYKNTSRISFQNFEIFKKITKKFKIYNSNKTYNPIDFYSFKFKKELLLSLIIGFIDGDGSITKLTNRNDYNLKIKVHSSWLKNLIFIEDFLYDYFNFNKNKTLSKLDKYNYAYLCISNNKIIKAIKNEIIRLKISYMKRKWENI